MYNDQEVKVENLLAKKFNLSSLLTFAMPTLLSMIFMSVYTMVDGLFVTHYVGESALAAINLVMPVLSITLAVGLMFSSGGSTLVSNYMGKGEDEKAKSAFTAVTIVGIIFGVLATIVVMSASEQIVKLLVGSQDVSQETIIHAEKYLLVLGGFSILNVLQVFAQGFFITAGKPIYGLASIIIGGLFNVLLDYILVGVCGMGVMGAAVATGVSYCIPAFLFLGYFAINHKGTLYFTKFKIVPKEIIKVCTNGSSELVTNISAAIITIVFNVTLLRIAGENGVAAISAIMYLQFMLTAAFMGYSFGLIPVISYKFGESDSQQLKYIFRSSMMFISVLSVVLFFITFFGSEQLISLFISRESGTFDLANEGLKIFAFAILFVGINTYSSGMFTAYSNGAVSALSSFLRTFVFVLVGLFAWPAVSVALGGKEVIGVWLAVPIGELFAIITNTSFFIAYRKKYSL